MSGNLAGSAAGYEEMHLDFHAWMLNDGDYVDSVYSEGTGGIKGHIESLMSGSLGMTPYSSVVIYNPILTDEPLALLRDSVEADLETVDGYDGDADWATYYAAAVDAIEGELGNVDTAVNSFTTKLQSEISTQQAAMDLKFSNMGAVNSTGRVMATALLEQGKNIAAGEYRAQLLIDIERQKMAVGAQAAGAIMGMDVSHFSMKSQFVQSMLAMTDMWITAQRQYTQDTLTMEVEDAYWDIKLYSFAGQALSSISGSAVIPGSPNPKLETLSTIAGIGGALSPLIIAGYKALT